MARPHKRRMVCALPHCTRFGPHHCPRCGSQNEEDGEIARMAVDEYETIRLIDYEGLTQEQCAQRMGVARTTAQAMYAAARKALAHCLVDGKSLVIEGGAYHVCEHKNGGCGPGCRRGRRADACPKENENGDGTNE